jgi:hypothetical protein
VAGTLTRDAFVSYLLEVMRRHAGAEIALINREFVKRAPFPIVGTMTRAELARALPYRAVVGAGRVSGAALESALAAALDKPSLVAVGVRRGGGGLLVNGRPLDRTRAYRVATIAFVAEGGDRLLPAHTIRWHPLPDAPDVRAMVESFLASSTAAKDGDPSISLATDFGPAPGARALIVGLTDVGLDLASTTITNGPGYGDSQLARAQQLALNADVTGLVQVRHPIHEGDARLALKYGWSRNQPSDAPAVAAETADLVTLATSYDYRGLRGGRLLPRAVTPDPYLRVWIESELTRPDVSPNQTRTYRHLQMADTAGALFTLIPQLKVRAGAGAERELLATGIDGRWRPLIEAGATLDPLALTTVGALAIKVEGLVDYDFVDPARLREHQLRATAKLSIPLVPTLYITVGTSVFAVQRERRGWAASYDTTVGLRVHMDAAHQDL